MPTMTYFITMKTKSRERMHSFLESMVREGEKKISEIGGINVERWIEAKQMVWVWTLGLAFGGFTL